MTSSYVVPFAQAIVDVVDGLAGLDNGATVKGVRWAPRDTDRRPAAVVELPSVERTAADESETQLSTRDVRVSFPVAFYFDLSTDLQFSQDQAAEVIEAFIDAIDAATNAGGPMAPAAIAGGTVIDAKASADPPEIFPPEASSARPVIRYVCRVDVSAFIPDV